MTARRRVRRVRLVLAAAVGAAAVGWAVAVWGGLFLLVGAADSALGLTRATRQALGLVSVILGAAAAVTVLWRNRGVTSLEAVALWLEERAPSMRYALVTLIEGHHPTATPRLESAVAAVSWDRSFREHLLRPTAIPLVAAIVVITALALLPRGVFERITAPQPGDVLSQPATGADRADPLRPIVVTLVPPAYAGLGRETLEDPETIAGLAGTRATVAGRGGAAGVTATLGERAIRTGTSGDRWVVTFDLPDSAVVLRLAVGGSTRLVVVDARPDSLPVVRLAAPARDSRVADAPRRACPPRSRARRLRPGQRLVRIRRDDRFGREVHLPEWCRGSTDI